MYTIIFRGLQTLKIKKKIVANITLILVITRRISGFIDGEITQSPALGTVRLIARKMLYVKCVGLCFRNLHVDLHTSFF